MSDTPDAATPAAAKPAATPPPAVAPLDFARLVLPDIAAQASALQTLRRDIHAHPELAFQENRTADLIMRQLQQWGIEVHLGLGGTGVVGKIVGRGPSGNASHRAIGLRADIDALPMTEHNAFPHASRHPGKMHACGHDGHTAMLLAAAQHLSTHRDFDGTVYLIFQPAEEAGGGAREMMRDGLFARFPMEAIFGMHNWPGMPAGDIAVCQGPCFASSNEFRIVVRGKGCHAAMPHLGVDPVPLACQLVHSFQTIVSRNLHPLDSGVISVTMIEAGEVTNVVPETVTLRGTVRSFTLEVLDTIEQRMRDIIMHQCAAFGATAEFEFMRRYPPTINHAAEANFVRDTMKAFLGETHVHAFVPTMGAEDFSFYLQEKPGAYFVIGNGEGGHRVAGHGLGPCMLHNPSYDFNDTLIPLGATLWVKLVEKWFSQAAC